MMMGAGEDTCTVCFSGSVMDSLKQHSAHSALCFCVPLQLPSSGSNSRRRHCFPRALAFSKTNVEPTTGRHSAAPLLLIILALAVSISHVQATPMATNASVSVSEDTAVRINLSISEPFAVPVGAQIVAATNPAFHGTLFQDAYPQVTDISIAIGQKIEDGDNVTSAIDSLIFIPKRDFVGHLWFTFRAVDDATHTNYSAIANVTIEVTPVNDAPRPTGSAFLGEWAFLNATATYHVQDGGRQVVNVTDSLRILEPDRGDTLTATLLRFDGPVRGALYTPSRHCSTNCMINVGDSISLTEAGSGMWIPHIDVVVGVLGGGFPHILSFVLRIVDGSGEDLDVTVNIDASCSIGLVNNVWSTGSVCKACLHGGVCTDSGEALPSNRQGFWFQGRPLLDPNGVARESMFFMPCDPEIACPSTSLSFLNRNISLQTCARGYQGKRCGSCADDFYRLEGECSSCPEEKKVWVIVVTVVAGLFFIGIILFWIISTGIFAVMTIVVTYVQTLGVFSNIPLEWSDAIVDMFSYLNVVSFAPDLLALECDVAESDLASTEYVRKMLVVILIPFAVALVLLLGALVRYGLGRCCCGASRCSVEKYSAWNNFYAVWGVTLDVCYLPVVMHTASYFECSERDDGRWSLDSEPGLNCFDDWWWDFLAVPLTAVILYAFFIPLYFMRVLMKRRAIQLSHRSDRGVGDRWWCLSGVLCVPPLAAPKVTVAEVSERYVWLVANLHERTVGWRLVVVMRKLLLVLTMLVATRYPLFQALMCLLILVISLELQSEFLPYNSHNVNRLEQYSLWSAGAILIIGCAMYGEAEFTDDMRERLGYVAIVVVCCSLASVAVLAVMGFNQVMINDVTVSKVEKVSQAGAQEMMTRVSGDGQRSGSGGDAAHPHSGDGIPPSPGARSDMSHASSLAFGPDWRMPILAAQLQKGATQQQRSNTIPEESRHVRQVASGAVGVPGVVQSRIVPAAPLEEEESSGDEEDVVFVIPH